MKSLTISCLTVMLLASAALADTKVKMQELPAPVQKAVQELTKTSTLVGLSKEVEKGKTMYEAETKVNGKTRDVLFDKTGAVVSVEEEVELAGIPAAARDAIQKQVAGGKIRKVESVTAGSTVSYEAAVTTKAGKKTEIAVNADGTPHKE